MTSKTLLDFIPDRPTGASTAELALGHTGILIWSRLKLNRGAVAQLFYCEPCLSGGSLPERAHESACYIRSGNATIQTEEDLSVAEVTMRADNTCIANKGDHRVRPAERPFFPILHR